MGEHIQKIEGKIHLYYISSMPFLQGHHDISKLYLFWAHKFIESKIFAIQFITDNSKWRPHENVKDNTLALIFRRQAGSTQSCRSKEYWTFTHWSWPWQWASVYWKSLPLKVSTPLPVRYPPLHLLQSSRMAKCRSAPREQKNTTWTSGSKKSNQVPSLTLISRTKSHCSKIGYVLYFSHASVGRESLWDLRLCPQ